jgi:hypothetical protein
MTYERASTRKPPVGASSALNNSLCSQHGNPLACPIVQNLDLSARHRIRNQLGHITHIAFRTEHANWWCTPQYPTFADYLVEFWVYRVGTQYPKQWMPQIVPRLTVRVVTARTGHFIVGVHSAAQSACRRSGVKSWIKKAHPSGLLDGSKVVID